jgi:hypothetical protein
MPRYPALGALEVPSSAMCFSKVHSNIQYTNRSMHCSHNTYYSVPAKFISIPHPGIGMEADKSGAREYTFRLEWSLVMKS